MLVALLVTLAAGTAAAADPGLPVCGEGPLEPLRRVLLDELNRARAASGARPVTPHPLLCELAAERAAEVSASGSTEPSMALLHQTTRAFYAAGYPPHRWTQSSLIADPLAPALEQWRALKPGWVREATEDEFEHAGVGVKVRGGQPAYSVLLALHKCTVERRRAEPLANLAGARAALVEQANRQRAADGQAPLAADPALDEAAQHHAEDMLARDFYDHRSPEGEGPRQRIVAAGFGRPRWAAENIAKGLFDPGEAVDRWMNSSGHRGNLLHPKARATGVGIAAGPRPAPECVEVVWVQVFAGP